MKPMEWWFRLVYTMLLSCVGCAAFFGGDDAPRGPEFYLEQTSVFDNTVPRHMARTELWVCIPHHGRYFVKSGSRWESIIDFDVVVKSGAALDTVASWSDSLSIESFTEIDSEPITSRVVSFFASPGRGTVEVCAHNRGYDRVVRRSYTLEFREIKRHGFDISDPLFTASSASSGKSFVLNSAELSYRNPFSVGFTLYYPWRTAPNDVLVHGSIIEGARVVLSWRDTLAGFSADSGERWIGITKTLPDSLAGGTYQFSVYASVNDSLTTGISRRSFTRYAPYPSSNEEFEDVISALGCLSPSAAETVKRAATRSEKHRSFWEAWGKEDPYGLQVRGLDFFEFHRRILYAKQMYSRPLKSDGDRTDIGKVYIRFGFPSGMRQEPWLAALPAGFTVFYYAPDPRRGIFTQTYFIFMEEEGVWRFARWHELSRFNIPEMQSITVNPRTW